MHVTVYVVVAVGITVVEPDVGEPEPVVNFVPVHDVALDDDQVSLIAGSPSRYDVGRAVRIALCPGGLMVTVLVVQPEYKPPESCALARNVFVPVAPHECSVDRPIPLATYPLTGSNSPFVLLLSQSIA